MRHPLHLLAVLAAPLLITTPNTGCAPVDDDEPAESELSAASGADPCGVRAKATTFAAARADRHRVGSFDVTLDDLAAGGALRVTHASDPSRVLFDAPAGRVLVAHGGDLRVEEHQGSFAIDEGERFACTAPRVVGVARAGGALRLRGRFADADPRCAAATFAVDLCMPREGHLAFDARVAGVGLSAITLEARSDPDERVFGLGEQFTRDTLDLKGRRIPVLAQEGGVGRGHQPISAAVDLASKGSSGSEDATYYPVPYILTSRSRSFFLENGELAFFDMREPSAIRAKVHARSARGEILHGRTPLEVIERFTEHTGRMPPLPPWVGQGAIVALARDTAESLPIVDRMRARGVEIAAVWNQTWSGTAHTFVGEQVLWNWAFDPAKRPGWKPWVAALAARGIRTLCYVNPMVRPLPADARPAARDVFAEGVAASVFVKKPDGSPLLFPVTAFDVGIFDLSSDGARRWIKTLIQTEMIDKAGCSGWMADFGEALPFEATMASGATGAAFHNAYPVEWARLNREVLEERGLVGEALVFGRSGHTRTPAYATLVWEGDQLTTWDKYDGLVSALHGLLSGGLSGIALNHSDTGGYTSLSAGGVGYTREPELLERWAEMNAFTAVLRTHEGNQPEAGAQVYDEGVVDHFARMSKIYKALAPYRARLFAEAQAKGWPVVRPLFLHYPGDAKSWTIDDEMLLGSEILVAPVKNKCWTRPFCPYDKEVYLPPGRWVHVWTGQVLGADAGATVTVKAPLGKPAVFYREGSTEGAAFVARLRAAKVM